jgi:hypothetical protein
MSRIILTDPRSGRIVAELPCRGRADWVAAVRLALAYHLALGVASRVSPATYGNLIHPPPART